MDVWSEGTILDVLLRHAAQIRATRIQTLAREKSPELTLAYLITNGY